MLKIKLCYFFYFKFILQGNGGYGVVVVVGSGEDESASRTPTDCSFEWPYGIAVDETTHSCFVCEFEGSIRKITFVD
jgi:hypothetical protein